MISTACIRLTIGLQTRLLVGAIFAISLLVSATSAQQLEPVFDANEDLSTSNIDIQKIYNLTEVAKSVTDYERIAMRCEKLLDESLFEKDEKYLNSMVAWSRNRLAHQYLKNSASMIEMGLAPQSQTELQRAIEQFDLVIQKYPNTWRAWMGRAVVHAQHGEYEKAAEKFNQVVKRNRKNKRAMFNCAEISLHLKDYDEAIEYYSRLLTADPTDIQSRTGRGHCYMANRKFEQAVDDYRTVAKLKTGDEIALCNFGDALQQVEQWDEALSAFTAASKVPKASLGFERLANFLVVCGPEEMRDPARAVKLANQAVENGTATVNNLNVLAAAYSAVGQSDLAGEIRVRAERLENASAREASRPDLKQRK